MTPRELATFKKVLEDEQNTALRVALQRRQGITIEPSADAFDQIVFAGERELALAELSRHSAMIQQTRAALDRIAAGTFGICQCCEKPIRTKRLLAVPWTALCIRCQENADAQGGAGLRRDDEIRATAA